VPPTCIVAIPSTTAKLAIIAIPITTPATVAIITVATPAAACGCVVAAAAAVLDEAADWRWLEEQLPQVARLQQQQQQQQQQQIAVQRHAVCL
jgi:hypothetical protein